ncbi:lipopolysaccharide biosynthesis protein [Plantactinospora sonchi]|uniref:Polysaccharide biosynthesis protein n=1 Tax=Plantactinospora sonchi TaxID=1544735 RepID=A0ABU7RRB2_9ACTN
MPSAAPERTTRTARRETPRRATISGARARVGRVGTLLTNGALLSIGVITSVTISRALGPSGRGEYVTWQTWATTLGILALGGLPQVLVLDDRSRGRHTLGEVLRALAVTLCVGVVMVAVLSALWRPHWVVLVASILVVTATQFGSIGPSEAQRMGRMGMEFNAARVTPQLAALLAMTGLLLAGPRSVSVWLLTIASLQAVAVIVWVVLATERGTVPGTSTGRTLKHSLRLTPGNIVTFTQYRLDLLVVTALFSHETVAFYAIGLAAQNAVLAAGQSYGMNWFARRGSEFSDRHRALRRELRKVVVMTLAIAVPLAASSALWVTGLYGTGFSPAVSVVAVLCFVGIAQSLDYLLAHECLMSGRGSRIALYRMPSLTMLIIGFGAVGLLGWPIHVAALIPGLSYLLSSAVFLVLSRSAVNQAAESGEATTATADHHR